MEKSQEISIYEAILLRMSKHGPRRMMRQSSLYEHAMDMYRDIFEEEPEREQLLELTSSFMRRIRFEPEAYLLVVAAVGALACKYVDDYDYKEDYIELWSEMLNVKPTEVAKLEAHLLRLINYRIAHYCHLSDRWRPY
jgi:hypothetical protein